MLLLLSEAVRTQTGNRFRKIAGNPPKAPWGKSNPADLNTPEQTRKALERERARVDRTGAPLAVAIFSVPDLDPERKTLSCLAELLQARLRISDEVGFLSENQVCALLIATPEWGARKVIAEILAQLPPDVAQPDWKIYTCTDDSSAWPEALDFASAKAKPVRKHQGGSLAQHFVRALPFWKRGLDIVGALAGLILLAPLLVLVGLLVKITSPGPMLFRQLRTGRGGKTFYLYKFRSMVQDAEARKADLMALNERDGPAFKIKRDPRITWLGRILRCTSLDELPQLWNILRGDMTLVGPRPLVCAEANACVGWQRRRFDVTPGLTCIWQVHGRHGVSFPTWMRMDLEYIRKQSFWYDLKLLLQTIPAVLLRQGAY